MSMSKRDAEHVFERLRSGVVPERGIDAFAVGVERQRNEIHRQLALLEAGEGSFKFLRGGYGCGKTFLARLAVLDAQARNFATSFVVVSDNDLHFHRFDDVYRKVVQELGTSACPRGALPDIIDRWIGRVEDALVAAGEDDTAAGFDELVQKRMEIEITARTSGKAPEDLGRVLRAIFRLKQAGEASKAGELLSWLSGSGNVASATLRKEAGIKRDIAGGDALAYLRGLLEIVKGAGYEGLVIIIDEAETILRMRAEIRGKSLNGIRQIIDAAGSYPGLLWVFTGTPEFFDNKRGVAGLAPLHDRVQWTKMGRVASVMQPQVELTPFSATRLRDVALRLRDEYPTTDRARLEARVTGAFLDRLVAKVTAGFAGDVGVVPRQFLRRLVMTFDTVEGDPDFDPATEEGFTPDELNEAERRLLARQPPFDPEPDDEKGYPPASIEMT
jgi:hypothetical protein